MEEPEIDELITPPELEHQFLEKVLDGEDAQAWAVSPIGKLFVRKAKDDYMQALHDMVELDLDADLARARALQMKARVTLQLIKYLSGAIDEGKAAKAALERMN